jgi:hypothetical protein
MAEEESKLIHIFLDYVFFKMPLLLPINEMHLYLALSSSRGVYQSNMKR